MMSEQTNPCKACADFLDPELVISVLVSPCTLGAASFCLSLTCGIMEKGRDWFATRELVKATNVPSTFLS